MGLAALQAGDPLRIGRYRLIGRLGSGGMGTVYLAQGSGGGDVAVKVLRGDIMGNPTVRTRFAREVMPAAPAPNGKALAPIRSAPDIAPQLPR